VGQVPATGFTGWLVDGEGDGVVSLESAKLENVESQIVVPADHVAVHRHPQSILEVRRILLEHVAELRSVPYGPGVQQVDLLHLPDAGSPPATPQHHTARERSAVLAR